MYLWKKAGKKAQQNMFWIVIGAVIALVVMIILIVMFTGKTGALETGLLDCESKGGICDYSSEDCKDPKNFPSSDDYSGEDGGTVASAFNCPAGTSSDKVCCFPPSKVETEDSSS